jgi:hypothetical protein
MSLFQVTGQTRWPVIFYFRSSRALLTEEALDKAGRESPVVRSAALDADVARRVSLALLPEEQVINSRRMATVYVAIAAFENSIRELVIHTLLEKIGADWWNSAVSEGIRKKAESRREEENKVRWHTPRGDSLINYTEFNDLASIMLQNWPHFEDLLQSIDWVKGIIKPLERSRNVIMHSGELQNEDIERVGGAIRDWVRQVGA